MPATNERTALLSNDTPKHVIVQVAYAKNPEDYEPLQCSEDFSYALCLEELLLYKTDPWWQFVRRTVFLSFWLLFFLILVTALMLAYSHGSATCKTTMVIGTTTARIGTDLLSSFAIVPAIKIAP